MSQDATKLLLGSPRMSGAEVTQHDFDPAVAIAGLALRMNSAGAASVTKADGKWLGVSLGRGLTSSDLKMSSVARSGLGIPMQIESAPARGIVTITSFANLVATSGDTLAVGATTFTFQAGAATAGTTQVQAATSNNATATSLAAQINGHATAGALFNAVALNAVVTITAKVNTTTGASIALTYTDTHGSDIGLTTDHTTFTGGGTTTPDFATLGSKVYISDTTGKADDPASASTVSNAVYASAVLIGIDEDGNSVNAIYVDMQGGL